VEIPAFAVADDIVMPAELAGAYAQLEADYDAGLRPYRDLTDAKIAPTLPLERRRAYLYMNFKGHQPQYRGSDGDMFQVTTLAGEENAHKALLAEVAARTGMVAGESGYNDYYEGEPRFQTTGCFFRIERAVSTGELAWLADWILLNYPREILTVEPIEYFFPGSL
jgi:hypothetical protein